MKSCVAASRPAHGFRGTIRTRRPRSGEPVRRARTLPPPRSHDYDWSNPSGSVLTPLREKVWAAERPFVWQGIDVGGKMGVVKMRDGSLWVHSPVDLDDDLRAALTETGGDVKHIVSPNFEHVKYAAQWKAAFPDAVLWGCPGMIDKKPLIPFDREVGVGDACPEEWNGEFELAFFDCEVNPFVGAPFFNEVVFHHRPSGVVLVTDLFWNYGGGGEALPAATRAWKFGMDRVYLPFYRAFMVRDRARFAERIGRVMAWEFDSLLPCHGTFVDGRGKRALREHLLPP